MLSEDLSLKTYKHRVSYIYLLEIIMLTISSHTERHAHVYLNIEFKNLNITILNTP